MSIVRRLLAVIVFALFACLEPTLAVAPGTRAQDIDARLRFDGVYHKVGYSTYLRFFEDGRMVKLEEDEQSGRVATYSSEESLALGVIGRYSVRRGVVEFSYSDPSLGRNPNVKAKGVIGRDLLDTDLKSWDTKRTIFRFVPTASPSAELPLGDARLRVDGAYEHPDPYDADVTHYLRFFDDGRVNLVRAKRGLGAYIAEYGSHWSVSYSTARYTIHDGVVEFDGGIVPFQQATANGRYSAKFGAERMEISFLGVGRTRPEVRRYYSFMPPTPLRDLIKLRVGQVVAGANGAPAQFDETIEFPSGSREIAYEITIDPEVGWKVEAQVAVLCGTASVQGRTNQSYTIVRGEPVVTRSFTVLSCTDGEPFRAGSYPLSVTAGGRPVTQLELAVR